VHRLPHRRNAREQKTIENVRKTPR
jgi:hypothetical protein